MKGANSAINKTKEMAGKLMNDDQKKKVENA